MATWYASDNPNGYRTGKRFGIDAPCLTVMAAGLGGDSLGHWHWHSDGGDNTMTTTNNNKPPYRVPTMAEIAQVPWNGFNVVSTFSGTGGSCLGYRMAGFKVLWASEFIPAAQACYKLNHPDSHLETRDIRQVQSADILSAIGLGVGEIDVFDGSPPCASFSTAGKREASWGKVKQYSDTKQRTDDLFFEYARLVRGLQPKVFVAENVSGLVKGTAKGYFKLILQELKACGYNVRAKVLDAQWLGVPQMRQRLIFIGVREDLKAEPVFPQPLPYQYSVREALPWIVATLHYGAHEKYTGERIPRPADRPSPAVMATSGGAQQFHVEAEAGQERVRVIHDTGGLFSHGDVTHRPSPTIDTNPRLFIEAETDISRYDIGRKWDEIKPGESHATRFNLTKPHPDRPCPTVVQSGGSTSLASVVHPTERRKFSIAELKRICAFPDDFRLVGSYAQQWERLGRAVPPVMMYHIAAAVRDDVLTPGV